MYTYLFKNNGVTYVYNPKVKGWWPLCSSKIKLDFVQTTTMKQAKLDLSLFDEKITSLAECENCFVYDHKTQELVPYVQLCISRE